MNPLKESIKTLRDRIKENAGNIAKAKELHTQLNDLSEVAKVLHDLWLGGWGQRNYNHYKDLSDHSRAVVLTPEIIYGIISNEKKISIDDIDEKLKSNLDCFKNLQNEVVTELSIIRDDEGFNNENELLSKIEDFKWGMSPSDYLKMVKPSQVPIYDMSILDKGLQTPPHFVVAAHLTSITTKAYCVGELIKLIERLLRQVELKIGGDHGSNNTANNDVLHQIFNHFHSCCTQLKNRYNNRETITINDEYDVQDLLHGILKLHFSDVREEEYTPSYAGKSTRMDFLLKEISAVIEVKKTRNGLNDKEVGEQLILDIAYYKNHPDCKHLLCFVYDPENRIKNPRGLEKDLAKGSSDEMQVSIFIRP